MKVFSLTMRWKSVCPPPTALLIQEHGLLIDHGAGDIFFFIIYFFFFFFEFPFPRPPMFFPNGDVPKLMQLL